MSTSFWHFSSPWLGSNPIPIPYLYLPAVLYLGKGKLMWPFSAQHWWISAFCSPACWLYPLKPGGEQKSADVRQKTVTLIYPDPLYSTTVLQWHNLLILFFVQVEVDDDDEAIGDDGDDGYNPNDIKMKSGVAKGVLDQVSHTQQL